MADGLQAIEAELKNLTRQVTTIGTEVTKTVAEVGIIKKVGGWAAGAIFATAVVTVGMVVTVYYQLGSLQSDVATIKNGQAQQAQAAEVQRDLSEIRELLLRALPPEEVPPEPTPPPDDGSKK